MVEDKSPGKIKKAWKIVKKINRFDLAGAMLPDYKFNKWIFRTVLLFLYGLFVYLGFVMSWDFSPKVYFAPCEGPVVCINPFSYKNYDRAFIPRDKCPDANLCAIDSFEVGQGYGTAPSPILSNFSLIAFGSFGLAIVLNHLLFNRKYKLPFKFDEEEEETFK